MGKRGRKPEGERTLALADAWVKQRPEPPEELSERAKVTWREVVGGYSVGHFKSGDLALIQAYCEAEELHAEAAAELARSGKVITTKTKYGELHRVNPWFTIWKESGSSLMMLATKLRICANSRVNRKTLGTEESPANPVSKRKLFGS